MADGLSRLNGPRRTAIAVFSTREEKPTTLANGSLGSTARHSAAWHMRATDRSSRVRNGSSGNFDLWPESPESAQLENQPPKSLKIVPMENIVSFRNTSRLNRVPGQT
mmetsp:Transcript_4024/g.7731  ORF Transcript_4024/g.7731 Transcript_4024/m.7731 type:complete len:108 (-) Transcript_4024:53-376(-)